MEIIRYKHYFSNDLIPRKFQHHFGSLSITSRIRAT